MFVRKLRSAALVTLAGFFFSWSAQAASTIPGPGEMRSAIQARYNPAAQATRVIGHVTPELCFSLRLPQEWTVMEQSSEPRLKARFSGAELTLNLRSAQELRDMPQPDLASRDAALLQQSYEELLGRPAQSVSLIAASSGATRWSATWIDVNLPSPSHAMTVEALIAPLSDGWVLELSLENAESREAYNSLLQRMVADLRVQNRSDCRL